MIFDLKLQKVRLRNREITVPGIQIFELLIEAEKQRSNSIQYSNFATFFFPFPAFSQETNKQTTEFFFFKKDILINKIEKQRSNSIQNSNFATFFFLCPAFSQETNKPTAEFKKKIKKINLDR